MAATKAASAKSTATDGGGARILLVEDDPIVGPLVGGSLKDMGYTVKRAVTADEAIAILSGGEPVDLLFTDMVMPGAATGVELAWQASALRPELRVVLTTGYTEQATVSTGFRVLMKPYSIETLVEGFEAELACMRRVRAGGEPRDRDRE